MLEKHGPAGGLDTFVEDIQGAVRKLKIVSWEAIRLQRSHLTLLGIYSELVSGAERMLSAWGADNQRREARMKAPVEEEDEECRAAPAQVAHSPAQRRTDRWGTDVDGDFRRPRETRPHRWEDTLKAADECIIDDMRTLLQRHYDEVSLLSDKKKETKRKKSFCCATYAHKKDLNQKMVLPGSVKEILQCPKDLARIRHAANA